MSEQKRAGRPPYPAEVRERAVRMVFDHQDEYPSQWKAIESISAKLVDQPRDAAASGCAGPRPTPVSGPGSRPTSEPSCSELEREVKELRRANEILKSAAAFFGAELDRQQPR